MADTTTTNLSLTKPEVGASTDTWGTKINNDLDALDAIFSATGTAVNVKFTSANFDDNAKAIFGTGDDLQIFHDGSDSYVNSNGADLRLKADDVKIYNYAGTEVKAIFTTDGSVDLYHNNVKKFETSAAGATIAGALLINGTTPTLTIGDAGAEDTKIVFDGNAQDYYIGLDDSADDLIIGKGSTVGTTPAVVIDENLNVGIGTTSPAQQLHISGTGAIKTRYTRSSNSTDISLSSDGMFNSDNLAATGFAWYNNSSEVARIDSTGNMLVGTTAAVNGSRLRVKSSGSSSSEYTCEMGSADGATQLLIRSDGAISFGTDSASPYNNQAGGSANAILLSNGYLTRTGSSLRYKKDIADATWGLTEVKQLRPVTFKSNRTGEFADDKTYGGLIAEEVHALGLTDFVDYNDDDEPDALHYANMVSLLTKAIQEQQTIIDDLKSRIETLEG